MGTTLPFTFITWQKIPDTQYHKILKFHKAVLHLTRLYTSPRVTITLCCWLAILTHTSWLSSFSRMAVSIPHFRSILPKPWTIVSHTTLNWLAGIGSVCGDGTTCITVFCNTKQNTYNKVYSRKQQCSITCFTQCLHFHHQGSMWGVMRP
jgi:hypothetical protein